LQHRASNQVFGSSVGRPNDQRFAGMPPPVLIIKRSASQGKTAEAKRGVRRWTLRFAGDEKQVSLWLCRNVVTNKPGHTGRRTEKQSQVGLARRRQSTQERPRAIALAATAHTGTRTVGAALIQELRARRAPEQASAQGDSNETGSRKEQGGGGLDVPAASACQRWTTQGRNLQNGEQTRKRNRGFQMPV